MPTVLSCWKAVLFTVAPNTRQGSGHNPVPSTFTSQSLSLSPSPRSRHSLTLILNLGNPGHKSNPNQAMQMNSEPSIPEEVPEGHTVGVDP